MKKTNTRVLIFLLSTALLLTLYYFALREYLDFAYLKQQQQYLQNYVNTHYLQAIIIYFTLYVATTATSFPAATVLTLAGGALFGLWQGILLVSFASTTGATIACLVSRYLLSGFVQEKYGAAFSRIDKGIAEEGGWYLLSLRLLPLFPYFLINLIFGLTNFSILKFFLISQIGMFPATVLYVNAGTKLGELNSPSEILSIEVLLSLGLLALLPLAATWFVAMVRKKRLYRTYPRPKRFDYNVIVLGAGAAGLVTAYIAAAVKAKVALIEKHQMGGDCLNTGCVPSKALLRTAQVLSLMRRADEFGLEKLNPQVDFARIMSSVQSVVQRIAPHDSVSRYTALGVDCISGEARIVSPHLVTVQGKTLSARSIVVATGAAPKIPTIPGLTEISYLTSETIWSLRELPKKLLILGGGPIGVELAQAFARFGSAVTIVERNDQLLAREDRDAAEIIRTALAREGVTIHTGCRVTKITKTNSGGLLEVAGKDAPLQVDFNQLLVALGRRARVTGFGLESLGVTLAQDGTILHDDFMQTNHPSIYVCGDVAGPYQFTHTAAHQAWFATVNALLAPYWSFRARYNVVPRCTFTDPEVAAVGLNETEAAEKRITFRTHIYPLTDLDRAITDRNATGFVKVLTPNTSDRILGATIVGAHAGELIIEFVLAMQHGIGLQKILSTIHIYPTMVEGNKFAAGAWKKSTTSQRTLGILARFHKWRRGGE